MSPGSHPAPGRPRRWPARPTDAVTVLGFRIGWGAVRRLPDPAAYRLFDVIADVTTRRDGKGVRRLRANYHRVRPELDDAALERLVRAGMRSYMRYYCDAFRLPDRSVEEIARSVRAANDGPIRALLESGRPAVAFAAHMGNWDTAGAWSTTQLAPVTSVVERLEPEEVFAEFLELRESLGMTILPLTGGEDPFAGLKRAVERGDFVAVVADRDLTSNGVEVDFCGHRARMAKGPAVLALMTRTPLFATAVYYEDAPSGRAFGGKRVVIDFSPVIEPPESGDSRSKVLAMTQQCADYIGMRVREHTESWHMLQRVFLEDLDAAPGATAGGRGPQSAQPAGRREVGGAGS